MTPPKWKCSAAGSSLLEKLRAYDVRVMFPKFLEYVQHTPILKPLQ